MFDWTMSLGNIITMVVLVASGVAFVYTNRGRIDSVFQRLLFLEGEIKRLVDVLVAQGRQEERLSAMDARVINQGARLDELTERYNHTIGDILEFKSVHKRNHPKIINNSDQG